MTPASIDHSTASTLALLNTPAHLCGLESVQAEALHVYSIVIMEGLAQSNYSHMRFCGLYLFIYLVSYDLNVVHWTLPSLRGLHFG